MYTLLEVGRGAIMQSNYLKKEEESALVVRTIPGRYFFIRSKRSGKLHSDFYSRSRRNCREIERGENNYARPSVKQKNNHGTTLIQSRRFIFSRQEQHLIIPHVTGDIFLPMKRKSFSRGQSCPIEENGRERSREI